MNTELCKNITYNKNCLDGAILHAWCWSFNIIKDNLDSIKAANFVAVQTSPISRCIDIMDESYGDGLFGNHGNWYYHYQPTDFIIGNYQLGTEEEFADMCKAANERNIKIIVDVVFNHCTADYNSISEQIKNISGKVFHSINAEPTSVNNRYTWTQGDLMGLCDLNTKNKELQLVMLQYLNKCVELGAYGFRFDAASHIELPDDDISFASDFWPTILNNKSKFQYGEILDSPLASRYAYYLSVTASEYAGILREAICNKNLDSYHLSSYRIKNVLPSEIVTWVESHDEYTEGDSHTMNTQQIEYCWAILAARKDISPLFFSRPLGSTIDNMWGINKVGIAGDSHYKSKVIAYLNKFKLQMRGQDEHLYNPEGCKNIIVIERGNTGAVIVNVSKELYLYKISTKLKNGLYFDLVNGDEFEVNDGQLSGRVRTNGIIILLN